MTERLTALRSSVAVCPAEACPLRVYGRLSCSVLYNAVPGMPVSSVKQRVLGISYD